MKASASLQTNNLVSSEKSIGYIHRNEVHLLENRGAVLRGDKCEPIKCAYNEKDVVSDIKWCQFSTLGGTYLVVVNQGGVVQLYDETGQRLIHQFKYAKSQGSSLLHTHT